MARRSALEARATRERIVGRSVDMGAQEGLGGLSIGRLAGDLGMSKSGILRHFETKERLQLAAVEQASASFASFIGARARGTEPGRTRLLALCDAWVAFVTARRTAGGCFFTAASTEFDGRPGAVRDAVAEAIATWQAVLAREVDRAVDRGELDAATDRDQVVFELSGLVMGLNQHLLLREAGDAPERARRAVRRILGVGDPGGR